MFEVVFDVGEEIMMVMVLLFMIFDSGEADDSCDECEEACDSENKIEAKGFCEASAD